jgi:ABC-type amino acid transport substrate-binding protein
MSAIKKLFISFIIYLCLPISLVHSDIKVGTVHYDPPYVFSLSQGFDIDLIHLICRHMNTSCVLIPMSYHEMFTQLNLGNIDIALDGIDFYTTPNRLNGNYIYSYPYLLSNGQFIALKNDKANSITELSKGSSVGLVQERNESDSGIFYHFISEKYGSQFKIKLFSSLPKLIEALNESKVSAIFIDNNEANYWILNEFKKLGKPMKVADGIGIIALEKNADLIAKINIQLKKIENDQEYINLYHTYIGMGS